MPFLVIGGHAINAYGISRQTSDIDIIVPLESKKEWQSLMLELRFKEYQSDERFSRFEPDTLAAWPIDLMYVGNGVFEKLFGESTLHDFGAVSVGIVSANHLLLLKLHALKTHQEHRFGKDYSDVLSLLRSGKVSVDEEELLAMCEKYASIILYNRIMSDLGGKL